MPQERFVREQLTPLAGPLGARWVYARERVQHRTVATDCLVAIGASRYSVPAGYVGESVVIRELLGSYEILHAGTVIARHRAVGRHHVVQEPAHYTGLLRPHGSRARAAGPLRYDPSYPASADMVVRDLGIHAALAEEAPV